MVRDPSWRGGDAAHAVSPRSRDCLSAIRREVTVSSQELGWTSLLLDHHTLQVDDDTLTLPPTTDLSVVAILHGAEELGVRTAAGWRWASYRAGQVGITDSGRGQQLRRRSRRDTTVVEKINLYIPHRLVLQVAEHYRRAGQRPTTMLDVSTSRPDPSVVLLARQLSRAAVNGAPPIYADSAALWLTAHLIELSRGSDDPAVDLSTRDVRRRVRVELVIDLIEARYSEPLTLDELAAEAHLSKFHLLREFRDVTGHTPYAYLRRARMEAARHLVETTDLTITQIGQRSGYSRAASFCAAFKAQYGLAPTAARQAIRQHRRSGAHTGPIVLMMPRRGAGPRA